MTELLLDPHMNDFVTSVHSRDGLPTSPSVMLAKATIERLRNGYQATSVGSWPLACARTGSARMTEAWTNARIALRRAVRR